MKRPLSISGLHHVALKVEDVESCERFYANLLGMRVEWRPDKDNVYLCSGNDNLALHRAEGPPGPDTVQRLDHIGILLKQPQLVDAWHDYLKDKRVPIRAAPRTHRDGARSFYCEDPAGNLVQMIYHPPLAHL